MNSFRVIGTKFRILKGGKIGLSLSISLIGSALIFGQISARAETFFDNEWTTGTTYTTPDVTATARSNTGTNTDTYSQISTTENIIFRPDRVAESYTGVADNEISGSNSVLVASDGTTGTETNLIADGTYTDGGGFSATNYDRAYYSTLNPDTDFTVTLTSGSTVNNIVKETSTYYYVDNTTGYTSSSDAYVANIVFSGSNTVHGTTNIDDGNIKLNGDVTFGGTVNAGSISVDTTNTIIFNSGVDLTAGTTDAMNFSVNGNVLLNENFTGNITTTADNQGNVTILGDSSGKEQIIAGNIGNSTSLDINNLNIGSGTNYSRTIINGDVFANSTVLNNTTTNSSTLILSNDKKITSTITTSHDNKGILTLSGGTQTVTGQVGEDLKRLAEINTGYGITTFSSDVYATNLDVEGTGEVALNGNFTGTAINFNDAGTVTLADGKNITSTITSDAVSQGTLNLTGTSTISGQVGDSTNKLNTINANGASGKTVTFSSDVYATNLDVEGTGEVALNGNFTGTAINFNDAGTVTLADGKNINSTITSDAPNQGTLNLTGTSTISGQVGNATNMLNTINANGVSGKTVTFSSDVYATNLDVEGTGEVALNGNFTGTAINFNDAGTVTLADGKNINSTITSDAPNQGTLNLTGTSTISGQVGNATNMLNTINANGASGKTVTFSNDVFATNLDVEGTGEVALNGNFTGTAINFNEAGTVILADGKNITSTITTSHDNKGILTLSGGTQTVTGQVGEDLKRLAEINTGYGITTFSSDVYATNLDVEGTGEVALNGNFTGTAINFNDAGTVTLADGKNINSTITSDAPNQGTLNLTGTSTISGQVGNATNMLNTINANGASGKTVTFSNDVFATNLDVEGTGEVALNGNFTGTAINFNEAGTVILADGKNITSTITSDAPNQGTLNLTGTSTISGQVGNATNMLNTINANGVSGKTVTFSSDVYATNLDVEGTGEVALNGNFTGTAINFNDAGTVTLADGKNINSTITSDAPNQGTLNLTGTSTISGQVGNATNMLNTINANGASGKTVTFSNDVFATTTNIAAGEIKFVSDVVSTDIVALSTGQGVVTFVGDGSGKSQSFSGNIGISGSLINTLNIGESGTANYSTTTISGNIYATNTVLDNGTTNSSSLILSDGSNITSTIKTAQDGQGILTFLGDSTVNGTIGTNTQKLAQINAGADGKTVTFNSSINSNNLNISGDGTVNLADNQNINSNVITATNNTGTLNLNGTSTVSGTVGTDTHRLKEINAGNSGGTVTFQNNVYATTTNVGAGVVNFNTVSGTTNSNIVFSGNETANLNEGLIGNIYFSGNDAIVNVSDGKGILGSVETLANNTGILNFKGDGTISGNVYGIKELNINTNNEQNTPDGVVAGVFGLARELYADVVALKNNATLTLLDNTNMLNSGSDKIFITTDITNTGTLNFKGTSNITGQVGESNKILNTINAGATGKTVTFNDMVYASIINYSDDGKVVLNGDNSLNANAEGFKGTVNFDSFAGKLEIGDDVNLTIGTAGTQFVNANNATLTFNGTSTIYGTLGGNTAGNSTFESIYAGVTGKEVTFKNDVYVKESTFHISEDGIVNFEGNLYGNLVFENNGILNIANTKSIIVSSVPTSITTLNNGQGTVNFEGTTNLYTSIGTENFKLNNVTFASTGNTSNIYNQDIDKNVYALNTYIGNGSNKTTLNIKEDITFGGNLNLRKDSVLNVSDYNVTVDNNLNIASNSTLNFKVNATDLEGLASSTYGNYGSINSTSLTIDNDSEIHISYVGTLNGTDTYDLIRTSNIILTNYEGTELNGLVSDDSIVNSIVKNVGNNLVLFVDRTGGGSFAAEDLYIEKSGIGKDYSNGASRSLAGYAKEQDRAGALTDIVRKMEYFEGGTDVSEAKKQEMIEIQRLLAPTANNSNIQSTITATNLSASTIKGRLSDIRVTQENNFTPNTYDYLGLSSGDYYTFDTSFWLKAMASKATQDRIKEYDGFDTSTYGFVGGMDKITNDGTIFGVALSYSTTKTKQDGLRTDDSDTTSVQATLYSSQEIGDAYVDGYLSYGKHKTDATRTANSGKLNSSVNSDQISAKVETGYKIPLNDGISLTPFASLEYSLLNQKGYTEKGSTYQNDALKVDSIKLNRGTAELGAKLVTNIEFDDTLIIPQFSASVYNSFGDNKPDVKAQFVGGGNKFVTPVSDMNDTMFNLGLGVETKISDSTSLIFDVDYDRSKDGKFEAYSGSVTFGVSF